MLNKERLQLEKIIIKATSENLPAPTPINLEIYRNYINSLENNLSDLQKRVNKLEEQLHKILNTSY